MTKCKQALVSLTLIPFLSPVLAPAGLLLPPAYERPATGHVEAAVAVLEAVPSIGWKKSAQNTQATPHFDTLNKWLDGLAEKESSNQEWLKHLDVNDRYSYGCLQFQERTFVAYSTKYFGEANLDRLNGDCEFQKLLARKMLEDDPSNWRHWYHSVITRGLGLPPRS